MRMLVLIVTCSLAFLASSTAGAQCSEDPIAVDDAVVGRVGPLWIDVTANDEEPDGEAVTVALVGDSCTGTATVEMNAVRLVVPTAMADCSLTYRLTDESGDASQVATVAVSFSLFEDGFESGATDLWSTTCTSC